MRNLAVIIKILVTDIEALKHKINGDRISDIYLKLYIIRNESDANNFSFIAPSK